MKQMSGGGSHEAFIARRLFLDKENSHHLSRKIILIALAGIALGNLLIGWIFDMPARVA